MPRFTNAFITLCLDNSRVENMHTFFHTYNINNTYTGHNNDIEEFLNSLS